MGDMIFSSVGTSGRLAARAMAPKRRRHAAQPAQMAPSGASSSASEVGADEQDEVHTHHTTKRPKIERAASEAKPEQIGKKAAAATLPEAHLSQPSRSAGQRFTDTALTLEEIRHKLAAFASVRDWDQFHTPRNLTLALTGEVGELSECFQWKSDASCAPGLPEWSEAERLHLGEEIADVMLYLVRLADRCDSRRQRYHDTPPGCHPLAGSISQVQDAHVDALSWVFRCAIDLPRAVIAKLERNAQKYPAHLCKGSAAKYTAYT